MIYKNFIDYTNIDYKLFIEFGKKFNIIKTTGVFFSKKELEDIEFVVKEFELIVSKNIDYWNMSFICLGSIEESIHKIVLFPFTEDYINSFIKPKFDKYLKLQVFI